MGRITKETTTYKPLTKTWAIQTQYHPVNGNVSAVIFNDNKAINYGYDDNQRMNNIKYNDRQIAAYTFYPNGTIHTLGGVTFFL